MNPSKKTALNLGGNNAAYHPTLTWSFRVVQGPGQDPDVISWTVYVKCAEDRTHRESLSHATEDKHIMITLLALVCLHYFFLGLAYRHRIARRLCSRKLFDSNLWSSSAKACYNPMARLILRYSGCSKAYLFDSHRPSFSLALTTGIRIMKRAPVGQILKTQPTFVSLLSSTIATFCSESR